MVFGKILFNNIKEYTPKWYPTIPYSQTVRPTFGILYYNLKVINHRSYLVWPLFPQQKLHGEILLLYSKDIHTCGKYLL